jgi:hypothetical protein
MPFGFDQRGHLGEHHREIGGETGHSDTSTKWRSIVHQIRRYSPLVERDVHAWIEERR